MKTLPDLLAPGLRLVFVGINPGLYSVEKGHYFARRTNRFWPAFARSRLSRSVRAGLGRDALGPDDDTGLLRFGIGFTDVVKRPSRNAAEVTGDDFTRWAPRLLARVEACRPRVVCFHGLTAFRAFARYGLRDARTHWRLGPQPVTLRDARVYVVPNPSAANAHFTLDDQTRWYDRLSRFLASHGPVPADAPTAICHTTRPD